MYKSSIAFFALFLFSLFAQPALARIPIYGKYCGPGNTKNKGEPIDAVDAACLAHDLCVWKTLKKKKVKKFVHGFQYCHCDRLIIRKMRKALRDVKKKKAKHRGKLIIAYFKRTKCICDKRVCTKVPVCQTRRRCKKISGKKRCTKIRQCKPTRKCKNIPVLKRGGSHCP